MNIEPEMAHLQYRIMHARTRHPSSLARTCRSSAAGWRDAALPARGSASSTLRPQAAARLFGAVVRLYRIGGPSRLACEAATAAAATTAAVAVAVAVAVAALTRCSCAMRCRNGAAAAIDGDASGTHDKWQRWWRRR